MKKESNTLCRISTPESKHRKYCPQRHLSFRTDQPRNREGTWSDPPCIAIYTPLTDEIHSQYKLLHRSAVWKSTINVDKLYVASEPYLNVRIPLQICWAGLKYSADFRLTLYRLYRSRIEPVRLLVTTI
jgi:hypothetical protein